MVERLLAHVAYKTKGKEKMPQSVGWLNVCKERRRDMNTSMCVVVMIQ